jgi:hypothetical protein
MERDLQDTPRTANIKRLQHVNELVTLGLIKSPEAAESRKAIMAEFVGGSERTAPRIGAIA